MNLRCLNALVALLAIGAGLIAAGCDDLNDPSSTSGRASAQGPPQAAAAKHAAKRAEQRARQRARLRQEAQVAAEAREQEAVDAASAESECDPNYSGACLNPYSSDYDCEGGSGNGPDYSGEVIVVGEDHYGLDADGDGTGCEPY